MAFEPAYSSSGRSDAPALILLNALGLAGKHWSGYVRALSDRYRVITIDRRGHGDSADVAPVDFDDLTDDIAAVLDAEGVETATIVGVSMGGTEAIAFAARRPERVDALVLANTFAGVTETAAVARLGTVRDTIASIGFPAMAEAVVAGMVAAPVPAEDLAAWTASLQDVGEDMFLGLMDVLYTARFTSALPFIEVPVLVLCGELDSRSPVDAVRILAESIPSARFQVVPGAGHFPHLEQMPAFIHAVETFLDRVHVEEQSA